MAAAGRAVLTATGKILAGALYTLGAASVLILFYIGFFDELFGGIAELMRAGWIG